jgi:hypothetical protein
LKKDRNVENYQELEKNVDRVIEKVKKENYKKTILNMLII